MIIGVVNSIFTGIIIVSIGNSVIKKYIQRLYCIINHAITILFTIVICGAISVILSIILTRIILKKFRDEISEQEKYIINIHPYYIKLILDQIQGIEDITSWAANHHEKIDGKGYPERLSGKQLGEIERLVCVCDIYQALTENRPYRKAMKDSKVWEIINDMVADGALCSLANRKGRMTLS